MEMKMQSRVLKDSSGNKLYLGAIGEKSTVFMTAQNKKEEDKSIKLEFCGADAVRLKEFFSQITFKDLEQ